MFKEQKSKAEINEKIITDKNQKLHVSICQTCQVEFRVGVIIITIPTELFMIL